MATVYLLVSPDEIRRALYGRNFPAAREPEVWAEA